MILHPLHAESPEATKNAPSLLAITQTDHAWLSAEMLKLFVDPPVRDHPRFQALLEAARRHDDGWMGMDAAPRRHPDGESPHDFRSLEAADREEVWTRTWLEFESAREDWREAWAAALILHHALTLHGAPDFRGSRSDENATPPPTWVLSTGLLERLAIARETQLIAATALLEQEGHVFESGPDGEARQAFAVLARDYELLALVDWLSLVCCMGGPPGFDRHGFRGVVEPETSVTRLLLDPFPFRGTTTWQVAARPIPVRPYQGDADLATTLTTSRFIKRKIRAEPMPTIQTSV